MFYSLNVGTKDLTKNQPAYGDSIGIKLYMKMPWNFTQSFLSCLFKNQIKRWDSGHALDHLWSNPNPRVSWVTFQPPFQSTFFVMFQVWKPTNLFSDKYNAILSSLYQMRIALLSIWNLVFCLSKSNLPCTSKFRFAIKENHSK